MKIYSPYELLYALLYNYIRVKRILTPIKLDLSEFDYDMINRFSEGDLIKFLAQESYLNDENIGDSKYSYDFLNIRIENLVSFTGNTVILNSNNMDTSTEMGKLGYRLGADVFYTWVAINLKILSDYYRKPYYLILDESLRNSLIQCPITYYLRVTGLININVNYDAKTVERLNSVIFKEMSKVKGYMTAESISMGDKLDYLARLNLKEGDIVFLYEREKVNKSSSSIAKSCVIAKITKIGKTFIEFTKFPHFTSLEGQMIKYLSYDESIRDLYGSFKEFISVRRSQRDEISLVSLGIYYMMTNEPSLAESYFITPIESIYTVNIPVFNEQRVISDKNMTMSEAIYYILRQSGHKFSRARYIERYGIDANKIDAIWEISRKTYEKTATMS